MTKKITPNFLRLVLVLIIFSQSLTIFSQNNVYLNVNWATYSGENKMELRNSSGGVEITISNAYDGANSAFLNQQSSTVSLPDGNYTVRVYDRYGDDWNGAGPYGKVFVDGIEKFNFNGDFTNNAGANTEIFLDYPLIIGTVDDASFSYSSSSYSISGTDPTPTITGEAGGTFTSTSGLSINSSTGKIDLSNSTTGTYNVTYTTTAPNQNSSQESVTITFAESQYYDNNKKYIEYIPGNMPVIISAPHGGVLQGGGYGGLSSSTYPANDSSLPARNCGSNERDDNTDILIKEIQRLCYEQYGLYPHIIINNLHRSRLDPNRVESIATCNNSNSKLYFDAFHNFIDQASATVTTNYGKGLYIDLHGQSSAPPRIEAGYNLQTSVYSSNLNTTNNLNKVTIKNLIDNNIQGLGIEDLIRGTQSLGGLLQTTGGSEYAALGHAGCSRTEGYRTVPSHIVSAGSSCNDTDPAGYAYFAGDYYNNIRHGSGNPAFAHAVVEQGSESNIPGGGGTIDGIMTEVNRRVRDMGTTYASYPYPYNRTDGNSATIPYFGRDYATVIKQFIDLHYNDFSNFSYPQNTYSIYGLDATPSIQGITGGTFSSTSGLSINSSTGLIDVSTSTQGTYTVTYTAPNVEDYYKKELQITINAAPVTNEFNANSGNWSVDANWSLGRIPILQDNVLIPTGKTINLDLENVEINDISVVGTLVINTTKSLSVKGNLNNTGSFSINSGGSLIVDGTSTGNLTYNRNLDANKWYLVGSPFSNQNIADFVQNHPNLATGSGSGDNQNIALAVYDNNLLSNRWDYYTNGETDGNNGDDTTDKFDIGKGYSTRVTASGDISFTGTLTTASIPKSTIIGAGNSFNLISNPYPSYLNSGTFLINNTGASKGLNNQTLWVWDQTQNAGSGEYVPKVTVQGFIIAPGQAFFVEAKNNVGVDFTENMQSHQSTDTFMRSNRPEIKLTITDGTNVKTTDIFYINGTTTGFDDGFDGEIFGGVSNSFALYTNLVTDNTGQKLGIQSLPNSNFESMIVPIGINAVSGTEITFTVDAINIPNQLDIYLEDKETNTFTKFNQSDSEYKITLNSDANGIGNFYIHTTSQVLSNPSETLNGVNAFVVNDDTLRIIGLQNDKINLKLISVLGTQMLNKTINSNGATDIALDKIPTGIYIVKIESEQGTLNKKILIK